MATAARLPIVADRVGACVRSIDFVGLDLTGVDLRMQVRLRPDTPGDPLIDLLTVTNAAAEGLRLVGVEIVGVVPTSTVKLRINETTMEDQAKVPYAGEPGTASVLSYDLIGVFGNDKRRLAFGEFVAVPTTYGSDDAPLVPGEGAPYPSGTYPTWNTATLTFAGDTVRVVIDGAEVVGALVERAELAEMQAQEWAEGEDEPGGVGSKSSKSWAELAAQSASLLVQVDAQEPALNIVAANRRVTAHVGGAKTRFGRTNVRALTVGTIAGRPASSVVAFFGNGGIQRSDIGLLLNIPYGQSLSLGTNSNLNGTTGVLTTVQHYGNLRFKGGVRAIDPGFDLSQFEPHIESIGEGGGAEDPLPGAHDSMLAQLFNAYNIPPSRNTLQTVSYAPGIGETAIDGFLEGTGIFDRLLAGVQAAVNLAAGRKVVVGSIKWMQGETRGSNTDAQIIAKLGALAEALDRRIRVITGQTEPVRLRTYQYAFGDAGAIFARAARQFPLIEIVSPIYDLKQGGMVNGSSQFDNVHRAAEGYFMYGARAAVVDFCEIYLKRAWRPLQIARDAQGRVRCHRIDADHLLVRYDVPFDGEIVIDETNALIGGVRPTGAVFQNGFFVQTSGGANIPLRDASIYSRNEILLIGSGIATAGNVLTVGSPLLTRAGAPSYSEGSPYPAATTLRDRMGDVLTIDDLGGRPLHNPAILEGWTMTTEELAR